MDSHTCQKIKEFLAFRHTRPTAVQRLRETLKQLLMRVQERRAPDVDSLISAAQDVVAIVGRFEQLQPNDEGTSVLILNAFCPEDDAKGFSLEDHLLNVAVLTAYLCLERYGHEERLMKLTLASLVHDVGMCLLPAGFSSTGPLEADELRVLRKHPNRSAAVVASWGEPFESLANVIAQEHERFDGRGYPLGLQGEDICLEARILGLVDTYEAMTHFRPFKLTHSPHWAMKTILAVTSHLFGPNLLNLIVRRFTLYPIGSFVELSSMEQGVVVGLNHDEPMRPHVYVACGRQGWKSPYPRVVNLKEYPLLHITRSLTLPGTNDPVVQNQAVSL